MISSNNSNTYLYGKNSSSYRLIFFPYAGRSALAFQSWKKHMPSMVEMAAVELPGRGRRRNESSFNSIQPLVAKIFLDILPLLDKPFAFFGHSMGALIAFEMARYLRHHTGRSPIHLFLSGREAPHLVDEEPPKFSLPDSEFLEEIYKMGGTPKELIENPSLMEICLPILRSDFQLCETYVHHEEPPLSCPITVFGGVQDTISRQKLVAWKEHTSQSCSVKMLPGGHFFINELFPVIINEIKSSLLSNSVNI